MKKIGLTGWECTECYDYFSICTGLLCCVQCFDVTCYISVPKKDVLSWSNVSTAWWKVMIAVILFGRTNILYITSWNLLNCFHLFSSLFCTKITTHFFPSLSLQFLTLLPRQVVLVCEVSVRGLRRLTQPAHTHALMFSLSLRWTKLTFCLPRFHMLTPIRQWSATSGRGCTSTASPQRRD